MYMKKVVNMGKFNTWTIANANKFAQSLCVYSTTKSTFEYLAAMMCLPISVKIVTALFKQEIAPSTTKQKPQKLAKLLECISTSLGMPKHQRNLIECSHLFYAFKQSTHCNHWTKTEQLKSQIVRYRSNFPI